MKNWWNTIKEWERQYRSLITVLVLTAAAIVLIAGVKMSGDSARDLIYNNTLELKKETYRNAVYDLMNLIDISREHVKEAHPDWTEAEIKNEVTIILREYIYAMDEADESYMWVQEIVNYKGGDDYAFRVIHPNLKETEGRKLSTNTTDGAGNFPYREELEGINKEGEVFLTYRFKELGSDKMSFKVTFSALYPDYNWIISRGVKLPAIEMTAQNMGEKYFPAMVAVAVVFFTGVAVIIVYAMALSRYSERLNEMEQQLRREAEIAKRANDAKTSFLFNMSHDIRTPMNAIWGLTNLLEKHLDDREVAHNYIKKIQESNEFLLSLINHVLEMARIESGKERLNEAPICIPELMHSVLDVFEGQLAEKDLKLSYELHVKHEHIMADATKMREIALNLVSNAVKYTLEGGVIYIEVTELPSDKPGFGLYQSTIRDSGIGMSESFLKHLYEEFEREQSSTVSGVSGTGLGMSIVKRLVDLEQGEITVNSELGKGTTFVLTVSHRIVLPEEAGDCLAAERAANIEDYKGSRVLLAEDNDINAMIASEILKDKGLEVVRVKDGLECIKAVKGAEDDFFDMVLMDIQMPHKNGYQTAAIIREMDSSLKANLPIVAMTANAFDEDRIRTYLANMNGHVSKPFKPELFFATIANALKGKKYMTENEHLKKFKEEFINLGRPCGYMVYRADETEEILYADNITVSITGCESEGDFLYYTKGSFRDWVHPDDAESIENEICRQQESSGNSIDQITYRIIRKDGEVRVIQDIGFKAVSDGVPLFFVYLADITDLKEDSIERS